MDKILGVAFDMDGTLLDTETICDRAWEAAARDAGIGGIGGAINLCRGCDENGTEKILRELYGDEFDAKNFLSRSREAFHEIEAREGIPLMRGAREALEYAKGKTFRMALASSTRGETVRRQMRAAGLLDFFDAVVTGDMVSRGKPAPEIYIKACAALALDPKNCVAFEDAPNGIKSAHDAGLRCVMVPDKIAPSEKTKPLVWKTIRSLEDIAQVL